MKSIPLFLKIIIAVVVCFGIGSLSGIATSNGLSEWYATIRKPSFNPPNWLFAPVWTVLYTMMGVAAALVWHKGLETQGVKVALIVFAIQLILNALWSILFFGMQNPALAFFEILVLWFSILVCIFSFMKVHKTAGYLLIPYILWVSFAAFLNFTIWQLN